MVHKNPATLVGNVVKDPELRFTPNGHPVINFPFATHAGKDVNGDTLTSWWKVTAWGKLADEVNKKVKKGMRLEIGGQIDVSPHFWTQKDSGELILDDKLMPKFDYQFTARDINIVEKEENNSEIGTIK